MTIIIGIGSDLNCANSITSQTYVIITGTEILQTHNTTVPSIKLIIDLVYRNGYQDMWDGHVLCTFSHWHGNKEKLLCIKMAFKTRQIEVLQMMKWLMMCKHISISINTVILV